MSKRMIRNTYGGLGYIIAVGMAMIIAAHGIRSWSTKPEVHQPEVIIQMGYMGLPSPPDCGHLYNVNKHKEWAECMGVGYND